MYFTITYTYLPEVNQIGGGNKTRTLTNWDKAVKMYKALRTSKLYTNVEAHFDITEPE